MTVTTTAPVWQWRPDFVVDLAAALRPLRRGRGDPSQRQVGPVHWRASTTPDGAASVAVAVRADGSVRAQAWGPGADWALHQLPALLGADDDPRDFTSHHDRVAAARHRLPHLRLGATGVVWDVLLAAVLEQKVTCAEAFRSWRELVWRFGTAAPGPAPEGLRVPPTPEAVLAVPDWEWHRAGVDLQRRRTLLAAASVAHRLPHAVELGGRAGRDWLRLLPGVGEWTAAEVAQRAWGDPDAVSFGDFHLATIVGWALAGQPVDDDRMAQLLAPYAPQRHRAVCYLLASGAPRPRFGPRLSPRNFRSC
ncbi:DNA-3-methyladenine glycosylase 2 family protein [Rhodococcus sp. X156]|uniref:DNA-3-methyladenine glycosylase family protein n=1 Tax=Rhodococcus sp. X156 TaxID=2499145 RepID=UPI000FD7329E|nr:DNA-3-methyladenine glycosylase 2 family protein [Rhodococcus sp. X156]